METEKNPGVSAGVLQINDCGADMKNATPRALSTSLDVPDSPAGIFSFPSAEDVHRAGDSFPGSSAGVRTAISSAVWLDKRRRVPFSDPRSASDSLAERFPVVESVEVRGFAEGVFSQLIVAPGAVRFRRRNDAAADRTIARVKARHALMAHEETYGFTGPLYCDGSRFAWQIGLQRRQPDIVTLWSSKSRNNLKLTVSQLDIRPLVEVGIPVMTTFTLPGNWENLTPTAKAASKIWNHLGIAWAREFGAPMRCLWKREFQRRGAPHWHVWTVLPDAPAGVDYKDWVNSLRSRIADLWVSVLPFGCAGNCRPAPWAIGCHSCGERERARRVAVRIDVTAGASARDPRRLAEYFLKESGGGSGKEYQNRAPKLWAGSSVGRFWGTRGIVKVLHTVDLDPREAEKVWRVIRNLRRSRRRRDGRKIQVKGRAGFVLVNDGPVFAAQLARMLWQLRGNDGFEQLHALQARLAYFDFARALAERLELEELDRSLDAVLEEHLART